MKPSNWYETYIAHITNGLSQRKACKKMNVPRSTTKKENNRFQTIDTTRTD